jgi:methyl-accepting chemotaxis protein
MENLSTTTEGLATTLMDNLNIAMSQVAESSGLAGYFRGQLALAVGAVQRTIKTTSAEVDNLAGSFGDLMAGAAKPTQKNIEELETGFADLRDNLTKALGKAEEGSDEYRRLASMLDSVAAATDRLNKKVVAGTLPAGDDAGDGGGGPTLSDEERKKIFTEQFNAAAALTEEQLRLAESTFQNVVGTEDLAVAAQGLRDAYGEVGGAIQEVALADEEFLNEDDQERIAHGTHLLQRASRAAQNIGAAMSVTSALTNAAFDSIKDGSKSFGSVVLEMLESLLKKAIALAAAFAAMSLIGGPNAAKALGSFKSFMTGGFGIQGFAEGGIVTGATLAMVGEGPGTSLSNPEVIAPLDKLQQMMGGGNVTVTGRLDGRDILISSERAGFDRSRVRGF